MTTTLIYRLLLLALCCTWWSLSGFAQYERKTLQAVRCPEAPQLDGVLDEPFWANAPSATQFIINEPTPGVPLPQATEVKIVYTDEAMYVGFMNFDNEPDKILQQLSGRDQSGNSDFCGITFSCYRDGINGFQFSVTPTGEQTDARLDALNGEDLSWNAVWNCKTSKSEKGWCAEFYIPFAAIRFENAPEQVWDINFVRHVRRDRLTAYWNGVDPLVTGFLTQMGTLTGISDIQPPNRVFLFPYASAYLDVQELPSGGTSVSTSYNAGLDLKLGLNDAFTLDATLIPDFGQVISDQLILNVSPFEIQFQDFRQFFTEGTELFNKANLFYSRRVGGFPIGYQRARNDLRSGEKIISNPQSAQLLNATKISGRNADGLGLGLFNALTGREFAIIEDSLGNRRSVQTSPVANYNIVVADQNLKNNSFISFINTNVTREGGWYDANVTGTQFDLRDKRNRWGVNGSGAYNVKYGQDAGPLDERKSGFRGEAYLAKMDGNYTSSLGVSMMSDTFDPNDLGFNTFNNFVSYQWNNRYNIFKPFWKLNNLWSSFNIAWNKLYKPDVFTGFNINGNVGVTNRKFHSANFQFDLSPLRGYDYFEARTPGQKFMVYANHMVGGWISTDYRLPIALDVGTWYTKWDPSGRYQFNWRVAPRFRLSDHWFITYVYSSQNHYNDLGFAGRDEAGNNVYGRRDVISHTNVLNIAWSATPWMTTTCRVRHYWGYSRYHELLDIQSDGALVAPSANAFVFGNDEGPEIMNRNFNSFTIDLIYRWIFIPGSELSVVWKNAINYENREIPATLRDDLDFTFGLPQNNNISVKVLYFLDYRSLLRKSGTRTN